MLKHILSCICIFPLDASALRAYLLHIETPHCAASEEKECMTRTIATEFPEFDIATLPAIPSTWTDESWHNDACPRFITPNGFTVFFDFLNPAEREFPDMTRFTCYREIESNDTGDTEHGLQTDDWVEVLHHILAYEFARLVRRDLAAELPEIIRRNATPEYSNGACATQDFCDANMIMAEAFESVMGHEVDGDSDSDCAAWNAAWDAARKSGFAA
jgi:hypothetical protein